MKLMEGDKDVWSVDKVFKQNKHMALVHGAEFAFQEIYVPYFQNTDNTLHIIADKVFVKTWKTVFSTIDTQLEKYAVCVKSCNIGGMKDLEEIVVMENIIRFHDVVAYTLSA